MIRFLDIKDPQSTHITWLGKVPALSKPRKFEFKPGLNILWGRNGSGKTTLIKALAQLFHCEQSGDPIVTHESLRALRQHNTLASDSTLKDALVLDHDGQSVRHFDPSHAVGLIGGLAGFDDDFMLAGIQNTVFKGSAGQTTMFRFDKLMRELLEGKIPEVERRVRKDDDGSKIAEFFLKGSGEKGPPTILLDEPDRSIDIQNQVVLWRLLRAASTEAQVIVAAHSLFALSLPEANYIELGEDAYLERSLRCLGLLKSGWDEEKPKMPPKDALKKAEEARKDK